MSPPKKTLSLIVPALNEEGNVREVCEAIVHAAEKWLSDYEILVFDDGSTDRTSEVITDLLSRNPHIRLFRNPTPRGLGYNYWAGIMQARFPFSMLVPGDNEIIEESLERIFSECGSTDLVVTYPTNPHIRPRGRQVLSNLFIAIFNFLFHLNLRYYNGPNVVRTALARPFAFSTSGFTYMASMLVPLIKNGASYEEVGFTLRGRKAGQSKALSPKNFFTVSRDTLLLFWKVYNRQRASTR